MAQQFLYKSQIYHRRQIDQNKTKELYSLVTFLEVLKLLLGWKGAPTKIMAATYKGEYKRLKD